MAEGSKWIFLDESTSRNRYVKTDVYLYSPFVKTLYLDCDTLVLSDISQISFLLDYFDILLRHIYRPVLDANKRLFANTTRLGDTGAFNSGVLGFRKNEKVERFFTCWRERFAALGFRQDQPSLVEALYQSDVRLLPLHEKWNVGDTWRSSRQDRNDVVIWHYKSRLDRHMESYLVRAAKWFSDDPKRLAEVDQFIEERRRLRGYGGIKWSLKTLVNELRGPLSKLPEQHGSRESWKRLFAD